MKQKNHQTVWQGVIQSVKLGVPGAINSARIGWPGAVKMLKSFPADAVHIFSKLKN